HNYQRSFPIHQDSAVSAWQDPSYASPQGCIYMISGGGGAIIYPERAGATFRPLMKVYRGLHHAVELVFSETQVNVTALRASNMEVLDTFTIRKDVGPRSPGFRRGDANLDGAVNIADAVALLGFLFQGAGMGTPSCPAGFQIVADTNGKLNEAPDINIADPI